MFAQRFDPTALEPESRKRRRSVDSSSDSDGAESSSESESSGTDEKVEDEAQNDHNQDLQRDAPSAEADKASEEAGGGANGDGKRMTADSELSDSSDSEDNTSSDSSDEPDETSKSDDNMEIDDDTANDYVSKHLGVFAKLRKSLNTTHETQEEEVEDVPVQDLVPLPQPELPRDKRVPVNYQHLNSLSWLATPLYATPEQTKAFGEFDLSPTLLKALETLGYKEAFSVQIAVLELLLKDIRDNKIRPDVAGDVLVNASTGSGKTLAYTIPVIEGLRNRVVPRVRAIILVPTKPLINQVRQTFLMLSKGTNLRISTLKNDISVSEEAHKIKTTVPDVIISTPGRLVEHLDNGSISLSSLRYLIIDEADRLLNQSFQNWCSVLINKIEADTTKPGRNLSNLWQIQVQKLIFSATLTTDAGKLALLKFHRPRLVIVNDKQELVNEIFSVPRTLKEYTLKFGSSKSSIKPVLLAKFLLRENKLSNVLVFTKSSEACIRLSKLLGIMFAKYGAKVNVQYINSTNNTTMVRNKLLLAFLDGEINVLVATDLIARGIDLLSIGDVVNYDMPNSSREYVHRVGRTARANRDGNAYNLLFGKGEQKWFSKLMRPISRDGAVGEIDAVEAGEDDERVLTFALQELQEMTI